MDAVRVPLSVVPYEDRAMKHQRQLESVEQDHKHSSESVDTVNESVKTLKASENSVNPVDQTSVLEEGAQKNENPTAPTEAPKQD